MTTNTRTEARLPEILEELYLGRTPDYRDEVLAAAVATRQRPWWTFPGRWLPMADIVSRPAYAPRLPWRTITVAFLIGALLLAAAVAYIGSRQARTPLPFGIAGNGLIAYAADGDIWTTDPTTGATTALVTGAAADIEPIFSPDGTRLAFRRQGDTVAAGEDILVASADGSNPIVITTTPISGGTYAMAWSPDSRSLLVGAVGANEVRLYDATQAVTPTVVAHGADFGTSPFLPPDGASVMVGRVAAGGARDWFVVDLVTGKETALLHAGDPSFPRWSPDGSRVVYVDNVPSVPDSHVLVVANADGTDAHRVTHEPETWAEFDPIWSPDGTRIAFSRAERVEGGPWSIRPSGIVTVATGEVIPAGPLARDVRSAYPGPGDEFAGPDEAFNLDWSPDGQSLLAISLDASSHLVLIDATSGDYRVLDVTAKAASDRPTSIGQAWQRVAR
jgi:Tol biopolymer transport system component